MRYLPGPKTLVQLTCWRIKDTGEEIGHVNSSAAFNNDI
jgi:hypothetical protein